MVTTRISCFLARPHILQLDPLLIPEVHGIGVRQNTDWLVSTTLFFSYGKLIFSQIYLSSISCFSGYLDEIHTSDRGEFECNMDQRSHVVENSTLYGSLNHLLMTTCKLFAAHGHRHKRYVRYQYTL